MKLPLNNKYVYVNLGLIDQLIKLKNTKENFSSAFLFVEVWNKYPEFVMNLPYHSLQICRNFVSELEKENLIKKVEIDKKTIKYIHNKANEIKKYVPNIVFNKFDYVFFSINSSKKEKIDEFIDDVLYHYYHRDLSLSSLMKNEPFLRGIEKKIEIKV